MTSPHSATSAAPLRVAVAGLGRLGTALAAAAADAGFQLVAAASARGPAAAADAGLEIPVDDLDAVLTRDDVDVVLHGGDADAAAVAALFERGARAGKDVVTSAALLHPRSELGPDAAARLDRLARSGGVRLLSTGMNPGLLLDLLPGICASLTPGWTRVTATRTVEAGTWGPAILRRLGFGGDPADVASSAPMSLAPSLRVLADLLGLTASDVAEARRPLVARVPVAHGTTEIAPGRVVGFHHTAAAQTVDGRSVEVAWHAVVDLAGQEAGAAGGVTVEVAGNSPLRLQLHGAFSDDPYPATAARMVASAAAMRSLAPGLLTVADVPFGRRAVGA